MSDPKTCVFDNPRTGRREWWVDGMLDAAILAEGIATIPAQRFKPSEVVGDVAAIAPSQRPRALGALEPRSAGARSSDDEDIAQLPAVGRRLAGALRRYGIATIGDLREISEHRLRRVPGVGTKSLQAIATALGLKVTGR